MEAQPSRYSKGLSKKHALDRSLAKPDFGELLSTEIWLMIFEELPHFRPYTLRLVSKRFNTMATPMYFRTCNLSDKIIARRPDPSTSRIIDLMKAHTKEFSIHRKLNWYRLSKFLSFCRAFRDLRWHSFSKEMPQSLPILVQNALLERPEVRLHFSTLYSDDNVREPFKAESIPSGNLFKMELNQTSNSDDVGMGKLNALISSSRGLRHMSVNPQLRFTGSHGRLPPITILNLSGDCWPYQSTEVSEIWDFSRLTLLSIKCADIRSFANSVPIHQLSTLTELSVWESDMNFVSEQILASERLAEFIDKLEGFRTINVDLAFPTRVLASLAKHGETLRDLAMSYSRQCEEWLIPHHVRGILVSCPHLVELSLEFNIPLHPEEGDNVQSYAMDFVKEGIDVICGFRNLRRLTIVYIADAEYHAQSLYRDGLFSTIERHLFRKKQGGQLQELSLALEAPGFNYVSDIGYSADYRWDSEGQLEFYDEYDPDEELENSSDDSDERD